MKIRKADADDISDLSWLIRESFRDVAERFNLTPQNCPKHPSNCTDHWILSDMNRGVIYFILEKEGKSCGCAAIEKADVETCYLERLAVLPEQRKKGFGRILTDHILSEARKYAVRQVSIGIIAAQTELKQWYEQIGFTVQETKTFPHLPFSVTLMRYEI